MLMRKLLDYPITDEGDIAFIKNKFLKWEITFQEMISYALFTFTTRPTMITRKLHIYDPLMADGKDRTGVDYQNSDKAPQDWKASTKVSESVEQHRSAQYFDVSGYYRANSHPHPTGSPLVSRMIVFVSSDIVVAAKDDTSV
eukprot:scaffold41684_cov81-Cyclotella_meneghiniana.AAC.1